MATIHGQKMSAAHKHATAHTDKFKITAEACAHTTTAHALAAGGYYSFGGAHALQAHHTRAVSA